MEEIKSIIERAKLYFQEEPSSFYFSPGRVNLIGEHIDYNGGYVLPSSISLGIYGAFRKRSDNQITIYSTMYPEQGQIFFAVDDFTPTNTYIDYIKGIIIELKHSFPYGFDCYLESTLPVGAGLSSSASLELLFAHYLNDEYQLNHSKIELILACQAAENHFVHVQCGIMDQFAIGMGKKNKAILLNTQFLDYIDVDIKLKEYQLVIINTNKKRSLSQSDYNKRRTECETALQLIRQTKDINYLCDLPYDEWVNSNFELNEILKKRVSHVISENKRTLDAYLALQKGNIDDLAALMISSHLSLRDDYEVSCLELDNLVALCLENGAIGARMTGAGFGGCILALFPATTTKKVYEQIAEKYQWISEKEASFYFVSLGGGVYRYPVAIHQYLMELVYYGLEKNWCTEQDIDYLYNHLCDYISVPIREVTVFKTRSLEDILNDLANYAVLNNQLPENDFLIENWKTNIMDILLPNPSQIESQFQTLYKQNPHKAFSFLYKTAIVSRYIPLKRVEQNIKYSYQSKYGAIKITINTSKPEKDPLKIAQTLTSKEEIYPKCQLCKENVGFTGNEIQESRKTLRIIPMNLQDEIWYFQYSPYAYFQEHGICLKKEHTPMIIERETIEKEMAFVKMAPHYFVGSNAELPIVGGSILNHEHYQCGVEILPIEQAKQIEIGEYNQVKIYYLFWPLSTIRLQSKNEKAIVDVFEKILIEWRKYENIPLNIYNFEQKSNTITPICRFREGEWVFDLILRNNATTEAAPWGIFHPRAAFHHIKKENIGLIEAMGLAILPGRLQNELKLIELWLKGNDSIYLLPELEKHHSWMKTLRKDILPDQISSYLADEVGKVFEQVLEDAGVFKQDEKGVIGFLQFIKKIF